MDQKLVDECCDILKKFEIMSAKMTSRGETMEMFDLLAAFASIQELYAALDRCAIGVLKPLIIKYSLKHWNDDTTD